MSASRRYDGCITFPPPLPPTDQTTSLSRLGQVNDGQISQAMKHARKQKWTDHRGEIETVPTTKQALCAVHSSQLNDRCEVDPAEPHSQGRFREFATQVERGVVQSISQTNMASLCSPLSASVMFHALAQSATALSCRQAIVRR